VPCYAQRRPEASVLLSLQFALRYRRAYDAPLASAVLGVVVRAIGVQHAVVWTPHCSPSC